MVSKKQVLAICGSTRTNSVNVNILKSMAELYSDKADFTLYTDIDQVPHFNPDLDKDPVPPAVAGLRKKIELADGVLICTPEYVFSLPGSFKNAIEWMVSTTVFTDKPAALITASSSGHKAHESLELVMRTVGVKLPAHGSLLISAPKTKVSENGVITDENTLAALKQLMESFLGIL